MDKTKKIKTPKTHKIERAKNQKECGCCEGVGGHFVHSNGKTIKIDCPNCNGKCKTCYGYGLWTDGTAPMGPMDASDGMPTIPCPECKADANPREKYLITKQNSKY